MSYTDIWSNDPSQLSMGMPTVDPGAAVTSAGQQAPQGLTAPAINTPPVPGAPQLPGSGAAGAAKPGFFSQYGPAQFALGAIQTLGSLWNSFQQNKLAKESFSFQKEAYATNLANQEQTYNTALDDRIRSRYSEGSRSSSEIDAEITSKSL